MILQLLASSRTDSEPSATLVVPKPFLPAARHAANAGRGVRLAAKRNQGDPTANWFIALTVTEDDLITVIGLLPVSALISVKPSVGTRIVSDVA